jgi:hypothetical protein
MDKDGLLTLIANLEKWALFFGILVAIGVAGESVYGIRLYWNNRKLQQIQDRENLELRAEIERSKSQLNRVSPRSWLLGEQLVGEGQQKVIAEMKSFARQKVAVFVNQEGLDDKLEAKMFAANLDSILDDAGWLAPSGQRIVEKNLFTNISLDVAEYRGLSATWILVSAHPAPNVENAALALSKTLNAQQILTAYPDQPPRFGPFPFPDDVIVVVIGRGLLP